MVNNLKPIGIPMSSISDKICSLLEDELISEISLEIKIIFNEYAGNFLGHHFILGLENFQHIH